MIRILSVPCLQLNRQAIADAVEIELLFLGTGPISIVSLADRLGEENYGDDLAVYDQAFFDGVEIDADARETQRERRLQDIEGRGPEQLLAEDAFSELEDRSRILGDLYPFLLAESTISTRGKAQDSSVYAFLLALSARYIYGLNIEIPRASRAFERLTAHALGSYVAGPSEHFGWPRDPVDEKAFSDALEGLARRMREEPRRRNEPIPARIKDQRLDAVAWRDLGDETPGRAIVLCQCAIGGDWDSKSLDIDQWSRLILFAVRPTRAIAFPFVPESIREFAAYDWEMLCAGAGIPLDRIRLVSLAGAKEIDDELRAQIDTVTTALVDALPR